MKTTAAATHTSRLPPRLHTYTRTVRSTCAVGTAGSRPVPARLRSGPGSNSDPPTPAMLPSPRSPPISDKYAQLNTDKLALAPCSAAAWRLAPVNWAYASQPAIWACQCHAKHDDIPAGACDGGAAGELVGVGRVGVGVRSAEPPRRSPNRPPSIVPGPASSVRVCYVRTYLWASSVGRRLHMEDAANESSNNSRPCSPPGTPMQQASCVVLLSPAAAREP